MSKSVKQWDTRLAAKGEDPRSFVLMGQSLGEQMDLADKGLASSGANIVKQQAASVDWAKVYYESPHVLTQVARSFDPTLGAESPSNDTAGVPSIQETMVKVMGIMERSESMTDQRTGFFTEEAMQTKEVMGVMDCVRPQLGTFLVELKVASDQVLACMTWGTTMGDLLTLVESGDDAALFKVLSVNPLLAYHPGIARRIQHATATQEHSFLRKMQRAIAHRPRRHKNGKPGFIMAVLWAAGLRYLSSSQIHDLLKAVGLQGVPSPLGLERYGQRLGLEKNHIDPRTGHEDE